VLVVGSPLGSSANTGSFFSEARSVRDLSRLSGAVTDQIPPFGSAPLAAGVSTGFARTPDLFIRFELR
jgi:hypothetical protein